MNILFVRNYPRVDGSFTLLLRLASQFKKDGHMPYYIDFGGKTDFEKDINETFKILNIDNVNAKKNLPFIDIIFPFADGDLLYWCINYLKHELFKNAKMVMGVYHPRALFCSTYIGSTPDTRLHKLIFENFPSENILFMNEVVKRDHENYFKIKFEKSLIVPLPVKLNNKLRVLSKVDRRKIVTICRLESFKRYVLPMIDVIGDLRNENYKFEFYIFGYGQLEKYIKNYIAEKNAGKYVFMMGKLEYEKIYQVLEDAFMFVGMGTTIIEASSIGVPSLLAIDSEKRPISYGLFNNLSGYCVGERKPDLPLIDMKNSILDLFRKNQFEYEEICMSHMDRANTFHIDKLVKQYYEFFKNASPNLNFRITKFKLFFYKIFRQIFKLKIIIRPQFRSR